MKLMKYLGVVSVLLVSSFAVQANERVLQVQGQGQFAVTPDAFTLTLVVEERGPLVSKLNTAVDAKLRMLVSFLREQQVEEKYIQSMDLRLTPWSEHTPQGRVDKGFVLTRELRVTHFDLDAYDTIIDGVLSRGVTRIGQFQFIASNESEAYQQALIAAVADAKSRASLLARELGVKIGDVLTISESGHVAMPSMPVMKMEMMDASSRGSLPGQKDVSARINVAFAIENK